MPNDKFSTFFKISPDLLCIASPEGLFTTINPAFSEVLGYHEDELLSRPFIDFVHPDDVNKTLEELRKNVIDGAPTIGFSNRYRTKAGGYRHLVWKAATDKKTNLIYAVARDVTESQEKEIEAQTILNTINEGMVIHDHNGKIRKVNGAAKQILGLAEDEILGKKSTDSSWRVVREDGSPFPADEHPAMQALRTGESVSGTIMGILLKSGEKRWIRVNATPFWTSQSQQGHSDPGENRNVVVTFTDVTDLIAARDENRYLLEALKIGSWRFDPQTREVQWDASMFRLFDADPKQFRDHKTVLERCLSPESFKDSVSQFDEAIKNNLDFERILEIKSIAGVQKYIGSRASIIRSNDGKVNMLFGISWDRTHEVKTDRALAHQQCLLQAVLDNIPNMVFVKDASDGLRFLMFNRAGQKLIGASQEEILGKNDFDFFPHEQAAFFTMKDREIFATGKPHEIPKEPIQTPRGQRWLRTYKVPTFKSNGDPDLLIGISVDITQELETQSALEVERNKSMQNAKLASLGEMSAGIAHEINNPLAIIEGTAKSLHRCINDPEKFAAKVEIIQRAVQRSAKIVAGLKKFARTSIKSEFEPQNLSKLINEVMTMVEPMAIRRRIELSVECPEQTSLVCNEIEIEQVLVNLINNSMDAIESLDERWVKLTVSEDEGGVVIRIRDSGTGISQEIAEKMFEPFYTTKPVGRGTGLGLSISKGILDEHGATIQVDTSDLNTCFEIRFVKILAV